MTDEKRLRHFFRKLGEPPQDETLKELPVASSSSPLPFDPSQ